jgi:nicotinamidase/pyrazinamidase
MFIKNFFYNKEQTVSIDVDAENCFTPKCMGELPVEDGDKIVSDLNKQAEYAKYRIGSKDAHSMASLWADSDKHPQFEQIAEEADMDIRWKIHGVPGTFGFKLIDGLPDVRKYDYFIWKGIELNMHPYGICYHDLKEKMSTGVIEWMYSKNIKVCIVGGLATDYCVKNTVLQLLKAKFIVILNLSACRSINKETEKKAIEEMKVSGVFIIEKTEELEKLLKDK